MAMNANYDPFQANASEINKFLADELKNLSFEQREAMHEEIHGVGNINTIDETPEFVQQSLCQMESAVHGIRHKPAFDRAVQMKSQYVLGIHQKFWLAFLRAEVFDIEKAALRYTRHLDILFKYFGDVALMRPIYFDDLGPADLAGTQNGWVQLLSRRDVTGRRILKLGGSGQEMPPMANMMRVTLYYYSVLMFDEETSKRGVVIVNTLPANLGNFMDVADFRSIGELSLSIPCRIAAMHICLPSDDNRAVTFFRAASMIWSPSASDRMRTKFHFGSPLEWQYQLLSFGLPGTELQQLLRGELDRKSVSRSFVAFEAVDDARKRFAASHGIFCNASDVPWVECPGRYDILFAQGGNGWSHTGNKEFRSLLESRRQEHSKAPNKGKAQIIDEIVETLKRANYRFLSYDKDHAVWMLIDENSAIRNKVAVAMRDHVRRHNKNVGEPQEEHSDTSQFLQRSKKRQKTGNGIWCSL